MKRTCFLPALFLLAFCIHTAKAGTIINGADQTGIIFTNTVADSYTFTANTGDSINLRLGTTNFSGRLQLYGPNAALLEAVGGYPVDDDLIAYTATNSGTFTVLVSSAVTAGSGTYALHLAQMPGAFIVPDGDEGGPMTNGGNYTGTITLGDLDMFTFTANTGDSINLRLGTTNFSGLLQLFGPNGALQEYVGGYPVKDDLIAYTATNSGTFTVLVSDGYQGETGTYALHLAQMPEAFIVPAGDDGGAMTNGGNYDGTITLGDLDMFSFTANTGDSINLRLGTTNFVGSLQLYGPNGALLDSVGGYPDKDDLIADTATNSGTFTVLVSDGYGGETGTYELHLAQMPEPFIVPNGDDGGPMTNGGNYDGTITLGDLDMYACTACKGDVINLELKTTNFYGSLQLYGPNGALLKSIGRYPLTDDLLAYTATNCGTFTVLISDVYGEETGTYGLSANGICDALRLSPPVISGTSLILKGVGGTTNTSIVLYSTTNLTTAGGLWTPVLTNHFDKFRAFNYTNANQQPAPGKYFRFVVQQSP
jgi:hypothetical protein